MEDCVDPMRRDQRCDARLVSGIADRERRARWHGPVEAGVRLSSMTHRLSGIKERMEHATADIAGAAGDQDHHVVLTPYGPKSTLQWVLGIRFQS
jgi:hypothetical protein